MVWHTFDRWNTYNLADRGYVGSIWRAHSCCWCLQDEDLDASLGQLLRTPRGIAEAVALSASLLGMLPFLYFEVRCRVQPSTVASHQTAGTLPLKDALAPHSETGHAIRAWPV